MTPERAKFHLLMLEAGANSLFHAELNAALAAEEPLSDLTLALSLCGSDEETMHVLREHLLDHPADMDLVDRIVREELRDRLHRGDITPERSLQLMHHLTYDTPSGRELELFTDVCAVEEYRDMAVDGILCDEAYVLCLEALLKAETLPDVWKLHREIMRAKRQGKSYPGEDHAAILTIPDENEQPKE